MGVGGWGESKGVRLVGPTGLLLRGGGGVQPPLPLQSGAEVLEALKAPKTIFGLN